MKIMYIFWLVVIIMEISNQKNAKDEQSVYEFFSIPFTLHPFLHVCKNETAIVSWFNGLESFLKIYLIYQMKQR